MNPNYCYEPWHNVSFPTETSVWSEDLSLVVPTFPQNEALLDSMLDSCLNTAPGDVLQPPLTDVPLIEEEAVVPVPTPPKPHVSTLPKCTEKEARARVGRIGKKKRAAAKPWSEEEHRRFKESLELFGRNWERCAAYIGTRRAQLVRSHAQKYLIKLWKTGEPLPKKVAESGGGYTLSGKPLLKDSASAKSYLTRLPCPDIAQE